MRSGRATKVTVTLPRRRLPSSKWPIRSAARPPPILKPICAPAACACVRPSLIRRVGSQLINRYRESRPKKKLTHKSSVRGARPSESMAVKLPRRGIDTVCRADHEARDACDRAAERIAAIDERDTRAVAIGSCALRYQGDEIRQRAAEPKPSQQARPVELSHVSRLRCQQREKPKHGDRCNHDGLASDTVGQSSPNERPDKEPNRAGAKKVPSFSGPGRNSGEIPAT